MRSRVTHALKPLDAMAVENSVQPGTPDVNYIGGWIELKSLDAWPKKDNTPVVIGHFNTFQRLWLHRRCKKGGKAWLVLRVGNEWLVLDGVRAAAMVGTATKAELIAASAYYWRKTPTDEELMEAFGGKHEA
jgi:hypothetical protein